MKKIFVLLSCVFSMSAFAGEEFFAQMEKIKPRAVEILKVNSGKTDIQYLYTGNCNIYPGPGIVSLNDQDQGYLKVSGRKCTVLRVQRLKPGEKRRDEEKKVEKPNVENKPENGPIIIDIKTSTGQPMNFYNNVN